MTAPAAARAAAASTTASAQSADSTAQVGEVIVTATRREEALRNVPIAVTAISAEQVKSAHIGNFADLPALVPGATFISTKGQSTANVQIRGQATGNDAPALEVPVAIFMDDVYFGTLASFDADFFDVSQIAILRGPQGTTFGRNVVGGALQITNNHPQLGVTSGEINATVETFDRNNSWGGEANGFVNAPLGDKAAVRFAYSLKDVGGYMHNVVTGHDLSDQKSFSIRPSVRYEPTDNLTINALFNYSHENEYASGYARFGRGAEVANEKAIAPSIWDVFQDVDGVNRRDITISQVKADWRQPYGTWTAITSYRTLHAYYLDDGDNTPLALNKPSVNASREFQFSQEFRLTSPTGERIEYVAGLYYSFENLRKAITFGFDGTNINSRLALSTGGSYNAVTGVVTPGVRQDAVVTGDAHVMNVAPYAEFKIHLNDVLALTLGGRYTVEKKSAYTDHSAATWAYGPAYNVPNATTIAAGFNMDKQWTAFTPRVILEFKPHDGLLVYGSISTGFKGGGWTLTATSALRAATPLEPERSTSYEMGVKTQLFDHRLSLNVAAYQANTKNVQVRTLVNGVLRDSNAGSQTVRGVELEAVANPVEGLQLGTNYAHTNAVYTSFVDCTATHLDCSGNPVPYVPADDVRLFVTYTAKLTSGAALIMHVDDQWASSFQVSPTKAQPIAVGHTARHGFLNASLTYAPANARWKVQIWAKNLTNQWTMPAPSNYGFYFLRPSESAALEVDRGIVNPPRQVGATFSYRFD
ncbi:MAG TPA: TonB-dependent receptor [Caulobacteraceae bacterium]